MLLKLCSLKYFEQCIYVLLLYMYVDTMLLVICSVF